MAIPVDPNSARIMAHMGGFIWEARYSNSSMGRRFQCASMFFPNASMICLISAVPMAMTSSRKDTLNMVSLLQEKTLAQSILPSSTPTISTASFFSAPSHFDFTAEERAGSSVPASTMTAFTSLRAPLSASMSPSHLFQVDSCSGENDMPIGTTRSIRQ